MKTKKSNNTPSLVLASASVCLVMVVLVIGYSFDLIHANTIEYNRGSTIDTATSSIVSVPTPVLDVAAYDRKMKEIAHVQIATSTSALASSTVTTASTTRHLWPVHAAYPKYGALLPFNRIIAYYGNFYSKGMGILGEYPSSTTLAKLNVEVKKWNAADPATPVIPAIDYIAITAQASAGKDGKYRARMPFDQIDHALEMARSVHGILFIDIQVGLSNLQTEVPLFEKYLKMPDVHLSIDPEFSMHNGQKPGSVVGVEDASDINFAAQYLAKLVRDNDLPPKILVVHRFKMFMVTNAKKITPLPEVQIVMDMDGWGTPERKIDTYKVVVYPEPVQFTGFKIFYKNDLRAPSKRLLTPQELLKLTPQPMYIQYQ